MTNFSYNDAVPATNNDPSVDQPDMLINTVSIEGIWNEDHIGFNLENGGTHQFLRFYSNPNYIIPVGTPTGNAAFIYMNAGTASSAAQEFMINANATYQVSPIKAWAFVDTTGAVLGGQSVNVSSVTHNSLGNYTIVLTTNATTGTNFAVVVSPGKQVSGAQPNIATSYTITGANTFVATFTTGAGVLADPLTFNFQVLQI